MMMFHSKPRRTLSPSFIFFFLFFFISLSFASKTTPKHHSQSLTYLWPLPSNFTSGNHSLSVDPLLTLSVIGNGGVASSPILDAAFDRYKGIIFKHAGFEFGKGFVRKLRERISLIAYDVVGLNILVHSDDDELQLGVDESYTLSVSKASESSVAWEATIEAHTVYGALRGLETFSQLCSFDYTTKTVQIQKAPWSIQDKPRFAYRGLMLDTSRHYLPINVIKQVIESMSYAKLNVLHWHIIDEESFPLEIPTYPNLWEGSYTKWERYTVEDAYEIVNFAKMRGINVMPEVDVPGHAESWGAGYPDLWPSPSCKEPLDVSKNFTFDVISGILSDMRKIFPFELFHLGGDEVHTDCWTNTSHVKEWLQSHNMTTKDAYEYFVLKAQDIALSKKWTPVNWEETFNTFPSKLHPETVVHNWLVSGVCAKAVAKGFRCIFSNQGVWYLDHLDVPWDEVYTADPLEFIHKESEEKLILGGEVCMWGETADASNVQQTIWPRAAAAAERMWSERDFTSTRNATLTALPRLQHFRCLLNRRGVPAAPVTNYYARRAPDGTGSCYDQ
ncbi:putative beta-N-acetylhexosaminidase [Medicago truncatula]|uniref:Beta-hexosaminidase n=1 Tax=Medicago truncatula TaxID=3880 RepID=A0A072TYG8_MEDTR|nr:beta-hexosaminidase 1 [Medicago truncatula]KEH21878.1 glycoside hydrolase family 20 domain protein [Medicago truncatula]RHN44736.1 putative beta-N-acetylhexosaminidase [Medicago truncatula]